MIVDYRKGSIDLIPLLKAQGVEVEKGRLEFGDVLLSGKEVFDLGVERKTVGDILNCIADGRFAGHQLPGLVKSYDYVWLVVEGEYRASRYGLLEVKTRIKKKQVWCEPHTRRMMATDLEQWLLTMELKGGIRVRHLRDRNATIVWLAALDRWVKKGWSAHKSHLVFHDEHLRHSRDDRSAGVGALFPIRRPRDCCDPLLLSPISAARRIAAELPHIGYEKSKEVVHRFPTVRDMVLASKEEWQEVDGIGEGIAAQIVKVLHG